MRVLLIRPGPSVSVQDVAFGWRDGLREAGVLVEDFAFDDRLDFYTQVMLEYDGETRLALDQHGGVLLAAEGILSACYRWWPDVVIIVSQFAIPLETIDIIRSRGHKIVFLFTESPYEDARQLDLAHRGDLIVLNDPTNLERFREVNPQSFYVPHAYDPKRHHPGPVDPDKACDFAFVGTGFPSRVEFFEQIDWSGLDVKLGGQWRALADDSPLRPFVAHRIDYCIDNEETADLYRSATTSLNLYRTECGHHNEPQGDADTPDGWACGPREIELAACGTWFARDSRPESDELFPMLPTFSEPGEVRSLIDWALAHDLEREEAAAKAQAAIADRTFANNARWLLNQLDK